MLTPNQDRMAYDALLNTLKASGVIVQDAQPDWPMLIHISNEYVDHLNQVKDKPAAEPMDPVQKYYCDTGVADFLVVYPSEEGLRVNPSLSFVLESTHGRNVKTSALLTYDDVRRLRDHLNQLLGE